MHGDESQLRHPSERPLFWAFVALNSLLMATSIFIVLKGSHWLRAHPQLAQYHGRIRLLAIVAIIALPATTFLRNGILGQDATQQAAGVRHWRIYSRKSRRWFNYCRVLSRPGSGLRRPSAKWIYASNPHDRI
jgi:hypothetical protein